MGFNASRMLFFQILYVPWIWTTKIWCSYAYFLHFIIIFNNLKSVCVTSENWNMDLKSQKLGSLARDKLRLSKKEFWCMFEHFFPLILPIFVGQTPKYSVVCFETDCAIKCVDIPRLSQTKVTFHKVINVLHKKKENPGVFFGLKIATKSTFCDRKRFKKLNPGDLAQIFG